MGFRLYGRGGAGQDCSFGAVPVQFREDAPLDVYVLDYCLDDQICIGNRMLNVSSRLNCCGKGIKLFPRNQPKLIEQFQV